MDEIIATLRPLKEGVRPQQIEIPECMNYYTVMGLEPGEEYKVSIIWKLQNGNRNRLDVPPKPDGDDGWNEKVCQAGPVGILIGFPAAGGFLIQNIIHEWDWFVEVKSRPTVFPFLIKGVDSIWWLHLCTPVCIHDNHCPIFGGGIHRLPTHVTISCG